MHVKYFLSVNNSENLQESIWEYETWEPVIWNVLYHISRNLNSDKKQMWYGLFLLQFVSSALIHKGNTLKVEVKICH